MIGVEGTLNVGDQLPGIVTCTDFAEMNDIAPTGLPMLSAVAGFGVVGRVQPAKYGFSRRLLNHGVMVLCSLQG